MKIQPIMEIEGINIQLAITDMAITIKETENLSSNLELSVDTNNVPTNIARKSVVEEVTKVLACTDIAMHASMEDSVVDVFTNAHAFVDMFTTNTAESWFAVNENVNKNVETITNINNFND